MIENTLTGVADVLFEGRCERRPARPIRAASNLLSERQFDPVGRCDGRKIGKYLGKSDPHRSNWV
ncbi:hypothetical protein M2272_002313 [Mycobacterium frederiksbergense]|uniref:Uncharacterized protein n=1 Tax=Mycolicibacterium frederiksbergense TaxID=117567 RepID=A0ABT6KY82_9MYCO|nr:hypothetical protein [Mycolicibacterium frederiksbergense]MDH6195673.1 hypothetical protein [Mycolicibacterium frederiksbergense]